MDLFTLFTLVQKAVENARAGKYLVALMYAIDAAQLILKTMHPNEPITQNFLASKSLDELVTDLETAANTQALGGGGFASMLWPILKEVIKKLLDQV